MNWLKSNRFVIEGCILLLGITLLAYFLYLPKIRTSFQLKNDLNSAQAELSQLETQLAPYNVLVDKKKAKDQKLAQLKKEFPTENEVPSIIQKLIQTAKTLNLDVPSITPASDISRGTYKEKSIEIKLQGGYSHIARFLGNLTDFSRRLNISKFQIKSLGNEPDSQTNKMVLTLTIITVVYTLSD